MNGHTIVMDAPERSGGSDLGPIPKPLLLAALAGCTGMDVAALLRKAGKPADSFSLNVRGEISSSTPIVYTSIHVIYDFRGAMEDKEVTLDAVTRSQLQYCGVSHMLKQVLLVTWK